MPVIESPLRLRKIVSFSVQIPFLDEGRVSLSSKIQGGKSALAEAVKFDYGDKARKARMQ